LIFLATLSLKIYTIIIDGVDGGDIMTQKELVKLAQQGNHDAFCALYDERKTALFRYAYYKLSNYEDAQDAVSDAVLSAFVQIKELKNPDAFNVWLYKILTASCNKYIKNQIQARQTENLDELVNISSGERIPDGTITDLSRALAILNDADREIVLLSAVSGFNCKEIAKITGFSHNAVRSRLSRALAKIRSVLE